MSTHIHMLLAALHSENEDETPIYGLCTSLRILGRKTAPRERPKALKTFYHLYHYYTTCFSSWCFVFCFSPNRKLWLDSTKPQSFSGGGNGVRPFAKIHRSRINQSYVPTPLPSHRIIFNGAINFGNYLLL